MRGAECEPVEIFFRSVPQMPHECTRIRISPRPISGTATVSSRTSLTPRYTAALHCCRNRLLPRSVPACVATGIPVGRSLRRYHSCPQFCELLYSMFNGRDKAPPKRAGCFRQLQRWSPPLRMHCSLRRESERVKSSSRIHKLIHRRHREIHLVRHGLYRDRTVARRNRQCSPRLRLPCRSHQLRTAPATPLALLAGNGPSAHHRSVTVLIATLEMFCPSLH